MRTALKIAAAAVAGLCALAAPAGVAAADETAADTIANLEGQGYVVNIDRIGTGSLENCVVIGVRNPQTNYQYVGVVGDDADNGAQRVIASQTIQVSLNCTG